MPDDMNANCSATQRLEDLTARLTDADLARDLGNGWTVTTALGHLAFWDRQQRLNLDAWRVDGEPPTQGDEVNTALAPILTALQPRAAAALAVAAARELDAAIAQLPPDAGRVLAAGPYAYIIRRARHRLEHIEQIEQAIASARDR